MGFQRADVGGSKRLPRLIKAVWAARAGDRARPEGELGRAGKHRPREPRQAQSSLTPHHGPGETRAGRGLLGFRASFSCRFAKRAPSPPAQLRERSGPLRAALAAPQRAGAPGHSGRARPLSAPGGEQ